VAVGQSVVWQRWMEICFGLTADPGVLVLEFPLDGHAEVSGPRCAQDLRYSFSTAIVVAAGTLPRCTCCGDFGIGPCAHSGHREGTFT